MQRRMTDAVDATRAWVDDFVIGLDLCPFAGPARARGRIRYAVTDATEVDRLGTALLAEAQFLLDADPDQIETTLLIHPHVLGDFLAYNDFLDEAEAILDEAGMTGVLQVASFHPRYLFGDAPPDDVANATNRSPHPMLHLLREDSVERAVQSHPDVAAIPGRNVAVLRRLATEDWSRLLPERGTDE